MNWYGYLDIWRYPKFQQCHQFRIAVEFPKCSVPFHLTSKFLFSLTNWRSRLLPFIRILHYSFSMKYSRKNFSLNSTAPHQRIIMMLLKYFQSWNNYMYRAMYMSQPHKPIAIYHLFKNSFFNYGKSET